MAFAGLRAMLAGALRDQVAAVGTMLIAGLCLATAWVLGIVAAVLALAGSLGTIGALLAVCAGLVVMAGLIVWAVGARNRRSSRMRATTRALWAATAVNAASAVLRGEPRSPDPAAEAGTASGATSHRSMLLIAGGLAMILLALLVPGGKTKAEDAPDAGPDGAA